jgi:hypothetical protein
MTKVTSVANAIEPGKLIPADELNGIMQKLEDLHSKLYTPKSAYTFFVKSFLKGGEQGDFGKAGKKWKEMNDKEKEPYEEMRKADRAKADSLKEKYDAYMQVVGPRLMDHDEQKEKMEVQRMKAEREKRFQEQKRRDKEDEAARKQIVKSSRKPKRKMRQAITEYDDYEASVSVSPRRALQPRAAPPKAVRQGTLSTTAHRSISQQKKDLMKGLDPETWEVRESRNNPGVLYYYNKKDMVSVAKPQVDLPQATKSQVLAMDMRAQKRKKEAEAPPSGKRRIISKTKSRG